MSDKDAAVRDRLLALIEPVVNGGGFDLEDLELSRAGRRSVLRVIVDGEQGFSLDDAARISGELSSVLDAPDAGSVVGSTPYTLEVTSPGVDRPLTLPRHWRRNEGRLVQAKTSDGDALGRIVRADEDSVTLLVDDDERKYGYDELTSGVIQLEFRKIPRADRSPRTDPEETA